MEPHLRQGKLTPKLREALLSGGRIVDAYSHKGSPGGHNNDCVILTMESGARISFDAYSPGYLEVTEDR